MGINNKKNVFSYITTRLVFYLALLLVWHFCYAATLSHIEDVAFFANTPDITHIQYQMPFGILPLIGNYISQFYLYPWAGAIIQALFPLLALLLVDTILWHTTHKQNILWLSYIPAILVTFTQNGRNTLTYTLTIVLGILLITLIVLAIPHRRWQKLLKVQATMSWGWVSWLITLVAIIANSLLLASDQQRKDFEYNMQLEQWAASHDWSKILDTSYPRRYQLNNMQLSYSLLALSEQHRLADRLFTYPIRGIEDLYNPSDNNPVQCRFNSFFCAALGFPNEAIRYAFEEGQGEEAGISFGSTRRMVDWLIERGGDMRQVDYYLNLLSHATCQETFVNTRQMAMLGSSKPQPKQIFFVGGGFIVDTYMLYQMDPANRKALDYMLCGLLIMQRLEEFYSSFSQLWSQQHGQFIPRHYEEALVMLAKRHPEINVEYEISAETSSNYQRFLQLLNSGKDGKSKALAAYGETYWGYLLKNSKSN